MAASQTPPSLPMSSAARVGRGMMLRCLLALVILTGMVVGAYLVERKQTELLHQLVVLLNETHRQRSMLTHAGTAIEQLRKARGAGDESAARAELHQLLDQMEQSYDTLEAGTLLDGPELPAEVRSVFFQEPHDVLRRIKEFSVAAREVSQLEGVELSQHPRFEAVLEAARGPALFEALDTAERSLAAAEQNAHRARQATERVVLLAMLAVIALVGVGVFRPMIREVRIETENFIAANQALDQRAVELAATLRELEGERDVRRLQMQEMARVMQDLEEERGKLEREIQARQLVQEALEASEQRSFAIIESAPTAMVVANGDGRIVMANARAEELFGYDREEIMGQPLEALMPPPAPAAGGAGSGGAAERARDESPLDLYCLRKDGRRVPVEVGTNPLEMEEGNYTLCAIVDITQRKQAEEEIKRINQELQRRNHEMQQFVYTISHDLKSPLVTCKGFVGLMKEDAVAGRWDVVLDSVGRIERAIQRMGDLIEDLLQLSRIGVIRNEPEEVHVGQMVRAIADELAERLQQAGAELEIQPDLPNVLADRVRLAEVFENLLSNAIKYGCRGGNGRITVGGLRGPQDIRFFVRDNGPGIAREFHRKVFGLFQRLDSSQEGSGVGLAAVARIMETHGGRAWVESAPGQGATFWIAFPLSCDTASRPLGFCTQSPETESLVAGS